MSESNEEKVSIATLRGGAVIEMIDATIQKVLDNIVDPNTEAGTKRALTIKMGFQTDEHRELSMVTVDCSTKLAGDRGLVAKLAIGQAANGTGVASEIKTRQQELPLANVTPIGGKGEKN